MTQNIRNTLGIRLQQRRADIGLSQRALAEKAGTTAAAISNIERGQRQPSADLLQRLAEALECTSDTLLSRTPMDSDESIYMARVTSAMKSFPLKVQEEVADYCDFLKGRRGS